MGILVDIESAADTVKGLLNPGGDPEAIFTAAAATSALASGVRETATALGSVAASLEKSWRGQGQKGYASAADAYQNAWAKYSQAMMEYAENLGRAADSVYKMGSALQEAQSEARKLWLAIDATLVGGAVLTFFTFGVSDEAAIAMAETDIAVAAGAMTALEGLIFNSLVLLDAACDALITVSAQFVLGVLSDGAALVLEKMKDGLDPWSPQSWNPDDLTNVLLGGLVSGILGLAFNTESLLAFQQARPYLSSGVWGAAGAFVWAVPWEFWIQGQSPLSLKTWEDIMGSTATSLVTAPLLRLGSESLGSLPGGLGTVFKDGPTGLPGVTKADVLNNAFVFPITGEKLILFTGGTQPQAVTAPDAGNPPGPVPAPDLPETQVPVVPAHVGGGTVTVAPGDTLDGIAQQHLGNPGLAPAIQANNPLTVGPDGSIAVGAKVVIPVLPKLPAGSAAQVVQPGQSLSVIAGGDPALEHKIAQLNSLSSDSVLHPGQVLIIPPVG